MTSTRLMRSFLHVSLKDTDRPGTLVVIQTRTGNGFVALMHN